MHMWVLAELVVCAYVGWGGCGGVVCTCGVFDGGGVVCKYKCAVVVVEVVCVHHVHIACVHFTSSECVCVCVCVCVCGGGGGLRVCACMCMCMHACVCL